MIEHESSLKMPELVIPSSTAAAADAPVDQSFPPDVQERVAEILDSYLDDLQHGRHCSAEELIAQHSDLEAPLKRYLGSLNLLHRAVSVTQTKVDATPPGQLGDFQILSELGRGGMGIVYQARQISLGRLVALKVLPFAAVLDRKQVARFQNEAQAAAQLHHPHIVPVYAVGCERGVHYYSMQFIDGQSLDRAMAELRSVQAGSQTVATATANKSFPHDSRVLPGATDHGFSTQRSIRSRNYVRSAVSLMIDAADALHYAHECGVIHRDVKPSNFLIDRNGKLWVADFGLARCQNLSNITATGDFFGTLRYMSPEQASGKMSLVDHRSDVYSLGVTLFEMLTLSAPFESPERTELLRMIAELDPPSPRRRNPSVPQDLETILLKTLSKSRDDRYSTAAEFAADLRRFLAGEPTQARRPTLLDRAGKWVSRHGKLVAAGLIPSVLAVATMATAAILLARQQSRTEEALRQAELHLRVAREMVDDLGARVAEDLAGVPEADGVRLHALQQAQAFYQEFLKYAADQPLWQRDVATAAFKRGAILEKLGRTAEAQECYVEARRIFSKLATAQPDDPYLPADSALCENNLGLLLSRENQAAGLRRLRTAESELAALATRFPEQVRIADDLRLVHLNLGVQLSKSGRRDEAETFLMGAIASARGSAAGPNLTIPTMRQLAIGLSHLSGLVTDREESLNYINESISLHRDLMQQEPHGIEHQAELATALNQLGSLRLESGNLESAQRLFSESLSIRRQLQGRAPLNETFQVDLATALNNLGMTYLDSDLSAADKMFDESLSLLRELVKKAPADTALRSEMAAAINNRGLVCERQGKIGDAIAAFREAVAEQEQLVSRSGDGNGHRDQLNRLNSNLNRALQAQSAQSPANSGSAT